MRWVLLVLCVVLGFYFVSSCDAAELTFSPAPEADAVSVDAYVLPVSATCAGGACAVPVRSAGLVRGQPVRNVGRVVAAPFRAIARAKPLRRAVAAMVRAKPLRRLAAAIVRAGPCRRARCHNW